MESAVPAYDVVALRFEAHSRRVPAGVRRYPRGRDGPSGNPRGILALVSLVCLVAGASGALPPMCG